VFIPFMVQVKVRPLIIRKSFDLLFHYLPLSIFPRYLKVFSVVVIQIPLSFVHY